MESIVIYASKYGATKQYAEWISKALGIPCIDSAAEDLYAHAGINSLIIGTSVYIGKLRIRKWLNENLNELMNKQIFLFLVCGTPAEKKEKWSAYINNSVPEKLRDHCKIYVFPGRMQYRKLNNLDKFLLRTSAAFTASAEERQVILEGYDEVDKREITTLLNDFISINSGQESAADASFI